MLTEEEKDMLNLALMYKFRPRITPAILKEFRNKTDEECRVLIAEYKTIMTEKLTEQKNKIEEKLQELS
jgi:hypothetical protein